MVRKLRILLSLVVVTAALLPAFGPLVDHHFAERQAGHAHVGEYVPHVHAYELAHTHTDGHGAHIHLSETAPAEAGSEPGIIILTNADGGLASLFSLAQNSAVPIAVEEHGPTLVSLWGVPTDIGVADAHFSPQSPPPKLLS